VLRSASKASVMSATMRVNINSSDSGSRAFCAASVRAPSRRASAWASSGGVPGPAAPSADSASLNAVSV
jgi:hypothetical protein